MPQIVLYLAVSNALGALQETRLAQLALETALTHLIVPVLSVTTTITSQSIVRLVTPLATPV
jgi:hypothetical protein